MTNVKVGPSLNADALVDTDLMYRLLVQGVRDHAIYMLDADGTVRNWNAGAERAKGYAGYEIIGCNYACFYSPDEQAAGIPERNLAIAMSHGRYATEGWRFRKDGSAFWASVVIEAIHDEGGAFIGFAKVTRDLTEKRSAELKAEYDAVHDALTGVLNRRGFSDSLAQRLDTAKCLLPTAILYVDLDHFKPVNDGFGHPVGDKVLQEVARRLGRVAAEAGTLGRLGGDEFAIFTSDLAEAAVIDLAQRIVSEISRPIRVGSNAFNIGASVGVSLCPRDGTDMAELLRNADLALYRAKFEGRNRVCLYDDSMGEAALARSNLEFRLRKAALGHDFHLLYQPIVDGRDGQILGYETLIRWVDEAGAVVGPAAFIPLAESIGLMPAIGEWALRRACEAAASWPNGEFVAVNLSATQFKDPPLVDLVIETLIETGLPPRRLKLEITETAVLEDLPAAKRALARLREIGVGIALDDFGTGFSSLAMVRDLPLTSIKIDQSFIAANSDAAHASAFIKSVIALCDGFGLTAIAEGVESEEQRALLLACGCSTMQGYLFGHPLPWTDEAAGLQSLPVARRIDALARR